ncbi:MAG: hypothetical protein ACI4PQ_00845 [Butyricicoccaceae bacterium]
MMELFHNSILPLGMMSAPVLTLVLIQKNRAYRMGLQLIVQAERRFAGEGTGRWKMRWVVRRLSKGILPFLRPIFTQDVLEEMIQELYETMNRRTRR